MSRTITFGTLKRRCREMADQEVGSGAGSSAFVDDTELVGMIQGSIALWHGKLVAAVPERFGANQTITSNSSDGYSTAADYYATMGVWYQQSDGDFYPLHRVQFQERTNFDTTTNTQAYGYYLEGNKLHLLPNPSSGTYRHKYITHAPDVTGYSAGDTLEGYNGWEEWIIYDVAIKMLLKEESTETASALMSERARIEETIDQAAADRDLMNPQRVVDVRRTHPWRRYGYFDNDFWSNR